MNYSNFRAGNNPDTYVMEAPFVTSEDIFTFAKQLATKRLAKGVPITSPNLVRHYLQAVFHNLEYEVFAIIFMDTQHRVIKFEEMFRGTVNSASVYPREVIKRALELNATAMVIAHNHPSGVPEPSTTDRTLTDKIKKAADLMDIKLLDHVVAGAEGTVSFAERGYL